MLTAAALLAGSATAGTGGGQGCRGRQRPRDQDLRGGAGSAGHLHRLGRSTGPNAVSDPRRIPGGAPSPGAGGAGQRHGQFRGVQEETGVLSGQGAARRLLHRNHQAHGDRREGQGDLRQGSLEDQSLGARAGTAHRGGERKGSAGCPCATEQGREVRRHRQTGEPRGLERLWRRYRLFLGRGNGAAVLQGRLRR